MLHSIKATIYRSGTSRGPYFLARDLPRETTARDAALLSIMGSGHPLQIDGIGGGNSLTSKVAIVSTSSAPGVDVDYLFAQVGIMERKVDTAPNCGNMMAGVAAFAIERGLVTVNPMARTCLVRILNLNSGQVSELSISVWGGRVHYDEIDVLGIVRPATRVALRFLDTAGAYTGKLLPTGRTSEEIQGLRVSIVDSGVPVVFFKAADLGVVGTESPVELSRDIGLVARIESVRCEAGLRMGLGDVSESVVPKVSLLSPGCDRALLSARYFTPKTCHNAHAVTGGICTASAANIEGTVVSEMVSQSGHSSPHRRVSIEHPSGFLDIGLSAAAANSPNELGVASVDRTVALIAEAQIFYSNPSLTPASQVLEPVTSPMLEGDACSYFPKSYQPVINRDSLPSLVRKDPVSPLAVPFAARPRVVCT